MVRLTAALMCMGILARSEIAQGQGGRASGTFRFSHEAGVGLQSLWQASIAAKQERVACLASTIRNDTVFVSRIKALDPEDADSLGISATASVAQCGPPEWSGTVHTHIALYTDSLPSTRFSAQDRTAMSLWYDRWHSDGVFCLIYSRQDAHCEADGVVGGMRSQPRVVHE
ncbi:MAG TPA: hypothetical protein VFX42_01580 [Gemmatimonadales bacterium]|nr:hypothetical protein [Gemmatimonadales bacterium]